MSPGGIRIHLPHAARVEPSRRALILFTPMRSTWFLDSRPVVDWHAVIASFSIRAQHPCAPPRLAIIERDRRAFFALAPRNAAQAPWNHPGRIIPPPKCLQTIGPDRAGTRNRKQARRLFKRGAWWVSDVADLQRECVCGVTRRSAARG